MKTIARMGSALEPTASRPILEPSERSELVPCFVISCLLFMVADPLAMLREHGLPVPAGQAVRVVENAEDTVYLVVPAKPDGEGSREPLIRAAEEQQGPAAKLAYALIQASRDEAFKKRLMVNPATTLGEHGVSVPDGKTIRVVENTAETRHLVLPAMPAQRELSDEQLDQVAGGLIGEIVEDTTYFTNIAAMYTCFWVGGDFKRPDPWDR
jgi:hypothetical protein